jgi:serine/threonine protein kinase
MAFHAHAVPIQSFLIQPEQVRVLSDNPQDLYKALLGQNTISKVWKGDYCGTQVALLSYHSALTTRKESLSVQSAKSNTPIKEILWQETLDVLTRIVLPNPHPNLVQVYGVSVEQTATEELSSQIIPVEEDDASNLTFIMENSWSLRMKKRQNTRKPSAKTSDETSSSSSSRRKNSTIRASFHKTSSFSMKSPTNVLIKEEKSNSLSEPIIMESMEIDVRPVYVVMEFLPTSLYQILHEDQIALTNFEIMDLSTQILQALQFVHTRGLCLHNLTSRKVMLKGNQVKIRGLGQKDILFKSGLILEEELQVDKESDNNRHHLFAFGLLLFEMCTGKIPNEENINQLS